MAPQGLDPDLRSLQEVRDCVARAHAATKSALAWNQQRTDEVCKAMAEAGAAAAYDLARLAVEETGIGRVHFKVLKNLFGSEVVWDSIRSEKTVGIIHRDERTGVTEVAVPCGVIAGIVPTTNPTSTALGKSLMAVKGRNAIILSPHPRAKRCISESAEVLRRAIERAGGPPDLVQCLQNPTIESTGALMKHKQVSLILATGGSGLVRAAYSSGKPAYGVGPGNVPAYIDRSADPKAAARAIVESQSFDNATFCCSEQALVLDAPVAQAVLDEMQRCGAHLCNPAETAKLEAYANRDGMMNPDLVGKDPHWVAEQAGFAVPRSTTVLMAHQGGVGREHKLSIEILCPLLSVHTVDGWQEGCDTSMAILKFGGLGHTCAVWAEDENVLDAFFLGKPASRIIVNAGSSQGAVGYSTGLVPSLSLGCGPMAGNITSDNVTAKHLISIKRAARPLRNWQELSRKGHERAAKLCGDPAPRGTLLRGDPALGGGGASAMPALGGSGGAWRGNPAFVPVASEATRPESPPRPIAQAPVSQTPVSQAPAPQPSVTAAPRPSSPRAPVFTRPGGAASPASSQRPATSPPSGVAPAAGSSPTPTPPKAKLSVKDIQSIMAHAGEGCPLGPCQGCPHQDVKTGACTA